jgi:hypothetical protein
MTKFEELTDIITRNKNKGKDKSQSTNQLMIMMTTVR